MIQDDFAFEPIEGLPERLPAGETILWQGRPDAWSLTKASLAFWWVMGWLGLVAFWRILSVSDLLPLGQAIASAFPVLFLAAIVGALLFLTAWAQARATVYTVTNRRIAMRIGAALTITINLPFTQVSSADLDLRKDGTGTIVLTTQGKTQFSYLVLWPHIRPWRFPARPALRCIPDAQHVAALIAEAAEARLTMPQLSRHPAEQVAAE
ncbi:MAG: photosynthetic complex putative assembly protein PuhB [Pseudomonadota bacterium]